MSASVAPPVPAEPASESPDRYQLIEQLGEGGMAVVQKVRDGASGKLLALKRLRPVQQPERHAKARALFEREFHVLSQLSHPRVVQVHDYVVDDSGPHYTMELLDGGDLHALAPVPWRRACSLMRDVCSVLALLHSRRLVHRDLSPRNIRCTTDGLAKLIDFGAMTPMGPAKQVVGTPPICAPEVLNLEPLDARADLYSLGATFYHALVGRHAYPARDFRHLRTLWQQAPAPPSAFVPDIPQALDALVMSMLSHDPSARPVNAAEVMERLSALANLPADEQLLVSAAYLDTPVLVGRQPQLARVRKKIERAREGRGSATMLLGAPGVGRSRLFDACMLEAKLLGAVVLRADAGDAQRGEYGAVRTLAAQLFDKLPEVSLCCARPRASVLAHVLPELRARMPELSLEAFDDPQQRRPRVQQALREWFTDVSKQRPLVLGVDDVEAVDEPSAAFVALLTDEISRNALAIVVSAHQSAAEASFGVLKVLREASTRLQLDNLDPDEVRELLRTVFGQVPHLELVAHKLHAIADGNPRDVMQLAQHLVDRGAIRYESGSWSLPARIDDGDLPSSIAQARGARLDALSEDALALAQALALAPELGIGFDEALTLGGHGDAARSLRSVDELLLAGVLRAVGRRFELAQHAWVSLLLQGIAPERLRPLHLRLSALFERRSDDAFRAAQHLLLAGEEARGLDALVAHARSSQARTDPDPEAFTRLLASLPPDWAATYRLGAELCAKLGRPRAELQALYSRAAGIEGVSFGDVDSVVELMAHMRRDSGLDIYESLDPALEPSARLSKSFELAQARYEQTPERDRVHEPVAALRPLARACVAAIGPVAARLDLELWAKVPSLAPFEPLSPALGVLDVLRRGVRARITGRTEQARTIYQALLDRANQPDRAGLDQSHHRYTTYGVTYALGMLEAMLGLDAALGRAKAICDDPMHEVNALIITMIYHLWQGDARATERYKRQIELRRIQNTGRVWSEGSHLIPEIVAHAASDDLLRVKQTIDPIAQMANNLPDWVPVLCYARAEYHRIRGDAAAALQQLERALELTSAGSHVLWGEIAAARLKVLDSLEQREQARDLGLQYLQAAAHNELGYGRNCIEQSLACVHAGLGEREQAEALADAALAYHERLGAHGLNLGLAHETRARVAIRLGDHAQHEHHARRCAAVFRACSNRALIAKHERLLREARGRDGSATGAGGPAALLTAQAAASHITSALSACPGPRERARLGLDLLVVRSGALGGFLYAIESGGPFLVAQSGLEEPPSGLSQAVAEQLRAEVIENDTTASGSDTELYTPEPALKLAELAGPGRRMHPTLIGHSSRGRFEVTGLAVLIVDPDKPFSDPSDIASHLSRSWFDSGDVTSVTAWLTGLTAG